MRYKSVQTTVRGKFCWKKLKECKWGGEERCLYAQPWHTSCWFRASILIKVNRLELWDILWEKGAEGWLLNVIMEMEILETHNGRKTGMRIKGLLRECLNINQEIRKPPLLLDILGCGSCILKYFCLWWCYIACWKTEWFSASIWLIVWRMRGMELKMNVSKIKRAMFDRKKWRQQIPGYISVMEH